MLSSNYSDVFELTVFIDFNLLISAGSSRSSPVKVAILMRSLFVFRAATYTDLAIIML